MAQGLTERLLPAVLATLLLCGCGPTEPGGPPSTRTSSADFGSLAEKVAFLEQYMRFRRSYVQLDFDIAYRSGGDGLLPAPSEWDIRIVARVPPGELSEWHAGLSPTAPPDTAWLRDLQTPIVHRGVSQWYTRPGVGVGTEPSLLVGVDPARSVVVYRSLNY